VVAVALVTCAASGPAARAATSDTSVVPDHLVFGTVVPGTTVAAAATLRSRADTRALVGATVTGTGDLAGYLRTRVELCAEEWTPDGCSPGARLVLDRGVVTDGSRALLDLPVARTGRAHLRVTLTLAPDAPQGASASLLYQLDVVGDDAPAPPLAATGLDAVAAALAAASVLAFGVTLRARARRAAP
jgi:hypothetical protein